MTAMKVTTGAKLKLAAFHSRSRKLWSREEISSAMMGYIYEKKRKQQTAQHLTSTLELSQRTMRKLNGKSYLKGSIFLVQSQEKTNLLFQLQEQMENLLTQSTPYTKPALLPNKNIDVIDSYFKQLTIDMYQKTGDSSTKCLENNSDIKLNANCKLGKININAELRHIRQIYNSIKFTNAQKTVF